MSNKAKCSKYEANRIFTLNEPNAPRLNPALAVEIGLNESIVFLQIEFYISINGKEHDGDLWVYDSIYDWQTEFPFWSPSTINRAIKSLEEKSLIKLGNYNQKKYDKTRWFAINFEKAAELKSIKVNGYKKPEAPKEVEGHGTGSKQNGTGLKQNNTGSNQDGTTIPETSTETSTESLNYFPPQQSSDEFSAGTRKDVEVVVEGEVVDEQPTKVKNKVNGEKLSEHPVYIAIKQACQIVDGFAKKERCINLNTVAKKLIADGATVSEVQVAAIECTKAAWRCNPHIDPHYLQEMYGILKHGNGIGVIDHAERNKHQVSGFDRILNNLKQG
ncbi:MAG TPA: hypothetical protein VF681_04850 [Abditibacteriaceae bacterium]|jgi:hypothetical protein